MLNKLAHQGVDAIQNTKKQFVSTFVQHDQLKKSLTEFVDAQALYTKSAIDAGFKVATQFNEIITDRTPYVNLSNKIAEYFPSAKKGK